MHVVAFPVGRSVAVKPGSVPGRNAALDIANWVSRETVNGRGCARAALNDRSGDHANDHRQPINGPLGGTGAHASEFVEGLIS